MTDHYQQIKIRVHIELIDKMLLKIVIDNNH